MSYDEDALAGRLLLKNCLEILGTAQALLGRSGSNEVNTAMAQARPLIDTANVHLSDALSLLVRGDPMSPAAADDPSDGSMVWTVALAAANLRSSGVEAAQRRQSREMSVKTDQSIKSSQDSPDLPGDSSVELANPDCPPPQAPTSAAPGLKRAATASSKAFDEEATMRRRQVKTAERAILFFLLGRSF